MAPITGVFGRIAERNQKRAACFETIPADIGKTRLITVVQCTPQDEFGVIGAVLPGCVEGVANGKGKRCMGVLAAGRVENEDIPSGRECEEGKGEQED